MSNANNNMQQLAQHTFQFAQAVREFGKIVPMTVSNIEDLKSLIRSSGKAGESLIRTQEAPNEYEFKLRMKTVIEELRTTQYYLSLMDTQNHGELNHRRSQLMKAADDLADVFRKVL
ncbi:MAG: hypothetical protein NWR72_01770 [Bacteroidia bacterium]|nr:hypothetical protein [Bacteroidia bacterium]